MKDTGETNRGRGTRQLDTVENHTQEGSQGLNQDEEGKYKIKQEVEMIQRETHNMNVAWHLTDWKYGH